MNDLSTCAVVTRQDVASQVRKARGPSGDASSIPDFWSRSFWRERMIRLHATPEFEDEQGRYHKGIHWKGSNSNTKS